MNNKKPAQGLWTWDFTIITLGSIVSLIGGVLSSFAMSMMVLDYTGSVFLYALFNAAYQIPMLVCPILAGPYLDRMSRKKAIYRLDFLSAGLFAGLALLLRAGWFSFPALLCFSVIRGAIDSVYMVAYDSLYPNLVAERNLSKAYSISGVLQSIMLVAYPLGAMAYDALGGVEPLFAINAVCFFAAACFETQIRHQETHMDSAPPADGMGALKRFRRDVREGVDYIAGEKGLLAITLYFMFSNFTGAGAEGLHLPFFRNHAALFAAWPVAAVTLYTIVAAFAEAGRVAGGLIQYMAKLPTSKKFAVAMTVYTLINLIDGTILFLPIPVMAAVFFVYGLLGVTSYNIRIAATQSYIPDGKRARFNGAYQMLTSVGSLCGTLLAGSLAEVLPERAVILLFSAVGLAAAWGFVFRNRREVAAIYNREV
ncbi:MAG: MFS transporter [Oscillospiraceae bacterium]|nr:MFS transporter [Oscillospiraceae bacterium]